MTTKARLAIQNPGVILRSMVMSRTRTVSPWRSRASPSGPAVQVVDSKWGRSISNSTVTTGPSGRSMMKDPSPWLSSTATGSSPLLR